MKTTDRVTISIPHDVHEATQLIAAERGIPFSSLVQEALRGWLRGQLVDAWLAEHQATHGRFTEKELERVAKEAGVPYILAAGTTPT